MNRYVIWTARLRMDARDLISLRSNPSHNQQDQQSVSTNPPPDTPILISIAKLRSNDPKTLPLPSVEPRQRGRHIGGALTDEQHAQSPIAQILKLIGARRRGEASGVIWGHSLAVQTFEQLGHGRERTMVEE